MTRKRIVRAFFDDYQLFIERAERRKTKEGTGSWCVNKTRHLYIPTPKRIAKLMMHAKRYDLEYEVGYYDSIEQHVKLTFEDDGRRRK